ncbi:hypothetical protein D1115_15665 [Vibrio alfacsensis]|uniref:Uncharacterized protein n=1 Tax=Vibrio alfacsensis TaxID=1074311 RepID=A0ABN5PKB4_9VIBR|nr:hypothetical protein D1115_15665 [Vibrio alfacsensis]
MTHGFCVFSVYLWLVPEGLETFDVFCF